MATIGPGSNPILDYAAQTAQAQASSQQTALDIHKQMDQEDMANHAAVVAREAIGNADVTMAAQKNSWQAATDAKVAELRTLMGSDPTEQGSQSNIWLARMQENAQKAYDAMDVIKEKQSKTLLNDPLGFINAQFTLPADIATHNYYAQKHNIAEQELNEITSASDANVLATQRAAQHTSTEYAIAEGIKAAQSSELDVARLIGENAGKRIQGLGELDNLNQRQLNNVFQAHSAANSDASLEMQRQAHKDMMDQRTERLKQKADSEDAIELERQAYNAGQRKLGKPTIEDNRLFRNIYGKNYGKNDDFMNTLGLGQSLIAAGGVANGIPVAANAGEAASLYASGGNNNLKDNQVGAFLSAQLTAVKSGVNPPKDKTALYGMVTDNAVKAAKGMLGEIRSDQGNIYAAPAPAIVLKAIGLATDPFLSDVVKPLVDQNPAVKIDDDTLVGKAIDYSKTRGNLDMAADGIANYYKMAILKNNLLNQYAENGLPAQSGSYNARIQGKIVNLADKTAVKNLILMTNTRAAISGDASFFNIMGQPGQ